MDHHRRHEYHHNNNNHPQHHHHHPHQLIDSSSSTRYLPRHPPPPTFPDDHPTFFPPPPHRHLPPPPPPPCFLHRPPPPPLRPPPPHHDINFANSPPRHHHHLHHRRIVEDDTRDVFRSPPNRVNIYSDHHHLDEIDRRSRFRLSELPPPPLPPSLPPPPPPPPRVLPSPIARRSPPQFVQFERNIRREVNSPPRFREDLEPEPRVRLHQLRCDRDRVDDRRNLGVFDRLDGDFDRDHDDLDRHEKYYPEMVPRKEFELNSGNIERLRVQLNDEVSARGGRDDYAVEENVNVRRGGSREISRSPIKFRVGGIEADDVLTNRGRKEDHQEYKNRGNFKKDVQKKSAFLRIQPGKLQQQHSSSSFRNRFDNTRTPSPHKGKEPNSESLDCRISEERVRSSVELDVSFKSNALVAKPIVAAPSCSGGVDFNVNSSPSDLGTRIDGESLRNNSCVSRTPKKEENDFKNRVRVSPIMKRLGNQNNVEVRGNDSDLSPPKSSSLSGGITCDAALKGEVSGKDDTNAESDNVSSSKVSKRRKVINLLSRLSRSLPTKTDSDLVNVDGSPNPSDGSKPSDTSVKQTEKVLSSGGNVIGSTEDEFVDVGEIDVGNSPVVVDQEENVDNSVAEVPVSKRMREFRMLEYLPDSPGSPRTEFSEGHVKTVGILQDEQRISNLDDNVTNSVDNCSLEIRTEKDSVKDQDMASVVVNNGSEEGSSKLVLTNMGDNVDINENCVGNVDSIKSVPFMDFISIPANVSNEKEITVDQTCPVVDADNPFEMQAFSSPENAIELSLGGLQSDGKYESESRESKEHGKLENLSIDVSCDKRTCSSSDDVTTDSKHIKSISDVMVTNDIQGQQFQGSDTVLVNEEAALGREESSETCINADCVLVFPDKKDSPLRKRKRKIGTKPDSLDLRISQSCPESAVSSPSPIENAILPVENQSSEVSESLYVESDVFLGHSVQGMNSLNQFNDLDPIDDSSKCGKKRKKFLLESGFVDAPGSESSELPLSAENLMPIVDGHSPNCSPQLSGGFELHNSEVSGKDIVDGATGSLFAESCSFADNSISDFLCTDSRLSIIESAAPDAEQSYLPESDCNQKLGEELMTDANDEIGLIALESACRMATNDQESNLQCSPSVHTEDAEEGPLAMNIASDNAIALNARPSSLSGFLQSCAESTCDGVTINSDMVDSLDTPSIMGLPEACPLVSSTLDTSIATPAIHVISGEKVSKEAIKSNQQTLFPTQSSLLPESHKDNLKPGISALSGVKSIAQKSVSVPSKIVKATMPIPNSMIRQKRNILTRSEASPSGSHISSVIKPSNKAQTFPAKPRTWNRANNLTASSIPVKKPAVGIPPPHRAPYGKPLKVKESSYIRKGNSLVRNPASAATTSSSRSFGPPIDRSKQNQTDKIGKMVGSVMIESTKLPDGPVAGVRSIPIEMPKTPPLPCSGKISDNDVVDSGDCTSSIHVDQSVGTDNEEVPKSSESSLNSLRDPVTIVGRNLEDPGVFSDGDLLGSDSKKMIYIKRKSNQLIAASKTSQSSLLNMDKATLTSSDINYFKRRKNQLIRASSEGNIQNMVAVNKDSSNSSKSFSQRAFNDYSGRSFTKRLSNKAKSQKLSLVWKLGDSKSCGKGVDALRSGRLLSHLLPWKRTTYWSRKLLSSRKRGAVYVRSGRGFSLRRSKVTSVPGTSLKWSKSMEKRSKVEEEAAAARDSMQKSGSSGVSSKAERSIHSLHKLGHSLKLHPGERIFRIGVSRYRMDSSRRTLQRISDEEASDFTASKAEKDVRKTYVPKRLLIGSDEYVRIGNGNQLVRDPKRRTRILASEKVRWSLHTARMRLAKKRKFCQFFTRFGKCNKGEGKCPFIHDPSKIAVCTKFLKALCVDSNCKLTHKVIPERMPDCSFFLQGLCSNENCPYRHVNVNPKASICENFLRGYCAEGNECRKKHSYICPEFEASSSCPQGAKCKLYHPKKGKVKKRKRDQKNAKGRYFGSGNSVVADPETRPVVIEKHIEPNEVNSGDFQGELGDFVSLGVSDDEAQEDAPTIEDGHVNLQLDDFDDSIIPLLIMG